MSKETERCQKCSVVGCESSAEYSISISFQTAGFFCLYHTFAIQREKPKFTIISKTGAGA